MRDQYIVRVVASATGSGVVHSFRRAAGRWSARRSFPVTVACCTSRRRSGRGSADPQSPLLRRRPRHTARPLDPVSAPVLGYSDQARSPPAIPRSIRPAASRSSTATSPNLPAPAWWCSPTRPSNIGALAALDNEVRPSQVTLKTVFTVAFGVLIVIAIVEAVTNAMLAVALTGAALLLAVALEHPVRLLERRGIKRPLGDRDRDVRGARPDRRLRLHADPARHRAGQGAGARRPAVRAQRARQRAVPDARRALSPRRLPDGGRAASARDARGRRDADPERARRSAERHRRRHHHRVPGDLHADLRRPPDHRRRRRGPPGAPRDVPGRARQDLPVDRRLPGRSHPDLHDQRDARHQLPRHRPRAVLPAARDRGGLVEHDPLRGAVRRGHRHLADRAVHPGHRARRRVRPSTSSSTACSKATCWRR